MVSSRSEIKLSSGGARCLHNNTGLEEKKKKKFTICSFISSRPLGTPGLPTEALNILTASLLIPGLSRLRPNN